MSKIFFRAALLALAIALLASGLIAFYFLRQDRQGSQRAAEASRAFLRGDNDGALRDYDAALACRMSNRNLALAYAGRGAAYFRKGKIDLAIRDLDEAVRRLPDAPEALASRASFYIQKGELDRALADFSAALTLAPNYFEARLNRGKIFLNRGQADQALADLNEAIRIEPGSAEAFLERGRAFEMKGDAAAALASYQSAQRLDPENKIGQRGFLAEKIAHALRGRALDLSGKDDRQAIAVCTEALAHHPAAELAATILSNRADAYARLGEREKAAHDFDEALRLDPDLALVYYKRADNALELGRLSQALDDYGAAIRLDPAFAPPYFSRGVLWATQGEFEKANADFDSAFRAAAHAQTARDVSFLEALARWRAASSHAALRNGQQAIALAHKACELTQWQNSRCLDTLAAAYAEAGDFEAAVKTQTLALQCHDFPEEVRKRIEERLALYRQRKPFH